MHKRLTNNARQVIKMLREKTGQQDLSKIDSQYLLREIKKHKGSLGKAMLELLDLKFEKVSPGQKNNSTVHGVLGKAAKIAYSSKSPFIGTEHLVQGILSMPEYIQTLKINRKNSQPLIKIVGIGSQNSKNNSSSPSDYFNEIGSMIDNFFAPQGPLKQERDSFLENYCLNLNNLSANEHPIVGREGELERISHVLGRRMKNNPVLIGEPGVGKTAIVEGLAQNIRNGTSPYYLTNKKIMSLDLGLLIAGTTFRGEFESRLKEVMAEIKRNPHIVLFIDEIHNLVGAGNAIGGMDAANLLKPVLSRGEVQVIGATTINEYQKHIEKDAALERRFQPILVAEPTIDETIEILLGIKRHYEKFHNVEITKNACATAASIAKRYVTDRYLPDSAIDLIDETSARLRSEQSSSSIYSQVKRAQHKKNAIAKEKELLVMNDRYEDAIRVRSQERKVGMALEKLHKRLRDFEKNNPKVIRRRDIRKTLSKTSHIPEELLLGQNKQIVKNVHTALSKKLVGQPHVSKKISNNILRQVSGIAAPNRPLGSFLFVGSTGVGKTYAAKLLSRAISPNESETLISINMSEFMEKHTTSRLLGAPAGYVGYEDGGELTDKIRRNPYSVVLFDEIEKADPSVLNILLQVLEEGELSDSKGRLINFRNTIVILTSNIGSNDLEKMSEIGFSTSSKKHKDKKAQLEKSIVDELHESLSPEFVGRLDDILVFNHLEKKQIISIISIEIEQLKKRLENKKIALNVPKKTLEHLAKKAFRPKQGARLVRKIIQEEVEPLVARILIGNKKVSRIVILVEKNKLVAKTIK